MGIHGLLAQIGPGQRISVAKLSAQHYTQHSRPLRLAVDISIWLFQIQSGKGGSNPALRTFYYRLLRLLSLNIWPLFVFDGPNKPLFKRNKKVGGPGVRVASVPEFLAKQLLKQFAFPWHVAPGEAEAECALLQREGIVDAVLSEDVDTLMFGSGVTVRNWTAENTTKSPTHANVYYADRTKEHSGMDREGMILVALMSGGDYLPEGIPGCGPKVACDAARAGFGRDLCALSRRDITGMQAWKDRLQHQIRTNEAKYFSRKNTNFTIPEDFPSLEVLGYYTHPCVSTPDKLARLRQDLLWDQSIDFPALRSFAADAFDWRCLGGAKKFIKNLAPAMLVRELRLRGDSNESLGQEAQEELERKFVTAVHGTRNHNVTDGELEYRISFIPANLVPIDLSLEEEDDQFLPAGGAADESDAESEFMTISSSVQDGDDVSEAPTSPSKKKTFKPFDPTQPEKLWMLKPFLQIGCPLLVEDYVASFQDPKEFLKARRKARAAAKGHDSIHAPKGKAKEKNSSDMPQNALMMYAKVTKAGARVRGNDAMKGLTASQTNSRRSSPQDDGSKQSDDALPVKESVFRLPATQFPSEPKEHLPAASTEPIDLLDLAATTSQAVRFPNSSAVSKAGAERPFVAFARPKKTRKDAPAPQVQRTPKRNRKRPSPDLSSPAMSQKTITTYYSPSPKKGKVPHKDIVDLVSSSPTRPVSPRPVTPSPPNTRFEFRREDRPTDLDVVANGLPDTVTKRRRKEPLKRWQTEPVIGASDDLTDLGSSNLPSSAGGQDLSELPDFTILSRSRRTEALTDLDATPKAHNIAVNAMTIQTPLPGDGNADIEIVRLDTWLDEVNPPHGQTAPFHRAIRGTTTEAEILQTSTTLTLRQSPRRPESSNPPPIQQPLRRSPRQQATKKRIQVRESLEGWWKEVDAEAVDLSGDGSGWKKSGGRARIVAAGGANGGNGKGWRKSGVEVLDLTGA